MAGSAKASLEVGDATNEAKSRGVLSPLQVLEPCVFFDEGDAHDARGPVSLFTDDELCQPLVLGGFVVLLFPVDEDNDIRILFERTGLP